MDINKEVEILRNEFQHGKHTVDLVPNEEKNYTEELEPRDSNGTDKYLLSKTSSFIRGLK